ncbi:hypothetical protein AS594_37555 [Streptomyces agglomeratus]|uniref:Uncharacterized protein n=1 Tax=Streptomyces agglomeratus TaxID=285458 RepID=A0A1E5NYD3_9ACTN|nr:hypothetical protein AS594_37555 [Streptomyces agglomeratus]
MLSPPFWTSILWGQLSENFGAPHTIGRYRRRKGWAASAVIQFECCCALLQVLLHPLAYTRLPVLAHLDDEADEAQGMPPRG